MLTLFAILWIIATASVLIFIGTGVYFILILGSFGERRIWWTSIIPFGLGALALYALLTHCPFHITFQL